MNALCSACRHLLGATVLTALLGPVFSDAAAQTARGVASREALQTKLQDVEEEIGRLNEAGHSAQARQHREEMNRLKRRLEGDYPASESDQPELHLVGVSHGSTAPPGVLQGPARFTTGYVELKVTYTGRPVVLALSGGAPIHWQVKAEPGVRFPAVILSGKAPRSVSGIPEGTLLFGQTEAERPEKVVDPISGSMLVGKTLERFTGLPVAASVYQRRYTGRPIVLGPENKSWRLAHNLSALSDLHDRAMQFRLDQLGKALSGLRFRGLYYTHGPAGSTAAQGDYTPVGPIAWSLEPVDSNLRFVLTDEKSSTTFALNNHWNLVVAVRTPDGYPQVPLRADMPTGWQFDAMALDTKRHRLIVVRQEGQPPLFAYDLETAQWSDLAKAPSRLKSLVYVAEEDVLYGLPESGGPFRPQHIDHLLKLAADGSVLGKIPLSTPIEPGGLQVGTAQLIPVDGKFVVLLPPGPRDPHAPLASSGAASDLPGRTYLIDPTSGEVVYCGVQEPHDGTGKPLVDVEASRLAPPPGGPLAELWGKRELGRRWVERLQRSGNKEEARRLGKQLEQLESQLRGEYRVEKQEAAELHYLGFYSKGSPVIEVTQESRPVVLALAAYEPVHWNVQAAPGVRLEKILVGGYHRQHIDEAPEGVPVEFHTHEDGEGDTFYAYERNSEGYPRLVEQLRELTGLKIATFYGSYGPPREPIVVGPENVYWRIQHVLGGLDDLLAEPERQERERLLEGLDELRFHAVHYPVPRRTPGAPPRYPHESQEQPEAAWAQFTVRGPLAATLKPIPKDVHRLAVDPQGPTFYGREGDRVFKFDLGTGETTDIPVRDVPRFSWPSAIAFDTERRRLLLSSFGGGGYLYGCDVDEGRWTVLRRPGLGGGPLLYVPEKDLLYSLNPSHSGHASLVTLNPDGAALHQVKVSKRFGEHGPGSRLQLAYADGHLIVLGPMAKDPEEAGQMRDQLTVIDPTTGEILYEGLSRPIE